MESKPKVKLIGEDGNAFMVMSACLRASRKAGWPDEKWDTFQSKAFSGDYDNLLATVQEHFEVE